MTWPRRILITAPAVLFVLAWIPFSNPPPSSDPIAFVTDGVTGWILIAAGLIAWGRRPASRTGRLLVLAGYLWYVGDVYELTQGWPPLPLLSFAFRGYYDVVLAFLVLAFPGDRLTSLWQRVAVGGLGLVYTGRTIVRLVGAPPGVGYPDNGAPNPFLLLHDVRTFVSLDTGAALAASALFVAIAILALARWRGTLGPSRRLLAPVILTAVPWGLLSAAYDLEQFVGFHIHVHVLPWEDATWWPVPDYLIRGTLAPLGFLIAAWLLRTGRAAVVDLVRGLDDRPARAHLRASLARALDDPSLCVLYPVGPGWVDSNGVPTALRATARSAVTRIESGGQTIAVITHDPALLEDPGLVGAVAATVRLVVDNEQLRADLEAQLDEVRASRTRIVEAGDRERRRLERDLHDGAQQRLVGLAIALRLARTRLHDADPVMGAELDAASDEIKATIEELRELSHGLDPAVLREAGLGPAIESLVDRSPVPVELRLDLGRRLPRPVEITAYFVVAESLTNVAKHAAATRVSVRAVADNDLLTVEVRDDGRGGADPHAGSGLRGLDDRVSAVGGSLRIESSEASGTRVIATLPCG